MLMRAAPRAGRPALTARDGALGADGPCLPAGAGDGSGCWSMLVPAFVLQREPRHARLRMEVEDSGGVVLTAYHSYACSQPPSSEPRCAPRAAASHTGSRYGSRSAGAGLCWVWGFPLADGVSARPYHHHHLIVVSSFGGLDESTVLCIVLDWERAVSPAKAHVLVSQR